MVTCFSAIKLRICDCLINFVRIVQVRRVLNRRIERVTRDSCATSSVYEAEALVFVRAAVSSFLTTPLLAKTIQTLSERGLLRDLLYQSRYYLRSYKNYTFLLFPQITYSCYVITQSVSVICNNKFPLNSIFRDKTLINNITISGH